MNINVLKDYIFTNGLQFVEAIIIGLFGLLIIFSLKKILFSFLKKHTSENALKYFIVNVVFSLMLIILAIIVLGKMGVPTSSLVAILGASSLAIGIALRSSLANVAAGILIIFLRPFRLGDTIEALGVSGKVTEINLFNSCLKTPSNELIFLPNEKLLNDKIINRTLAKQRRIDMNIGIAYDSDIQQAKELAMAALKQEPRVLASPEPVILVTDLADSAVILSIRPWVKRDDFFATRCDLLEAIKQSFDQHQITIPFPQMDVYVKQQTN